MTLIDLYLESHVVKTMRDTEEIYLYKPELGYYIKGETFVNEWLAKANVNTTQKFNNFKRVLKSLTYADRDSFGLKEGYLNLRNGVLNIRKKILEPHDPKHNFLNRLEINYDSEATAPMFEQMLTNIPEVETIQKWFAYHLLPGQIHKKAMFMLGKPNTGRSTLLNILTAFLGEENVTHSQFRDFSNDRSYAIANLNGRLGNIHPDLGVTILRDVSDFKTLVGDDRITARQIYNAPISFINSAKLTFAMNKAPSLYADVADDDAFWNRVLLIEFKNPIPTEGQVPKLGENIIIKEMSGVLNWALNGYYSAIEGFANSPMENKRIWIANSMDYRLTV